MRSSTPSKISLGSDAWDQSNTIPRFLGQRNTVPTTTAKGTKPSTVGPFEGTWRSSSSQGLLKELWVHPHSQSSLQTTNHSTFSGTTLDHPIQGDRLIIQVSDYRVYFLLFLILYTPHLNEVLFYAFNHCSTSIHYSLSIHMPCWWDFPYS